MDIMGLFTRNDKDNCYIVVGVDYFTKWLEAWALPNQEAKTIAEKLLEMFFRFPLPDKLPSDQGREVVADRKNTYHSIPSTGRWVGGKGQ